MPVLTIKAIAYAATLGITPRSLRRIIRDEKMPGARKIKGAWRVNPVKAEPWLRAKHPQIFAADLIEVPPVTTKQDTPPTSADIAATDLEATDRHIKRLNQSLDGMVQVLHDGTFDANLVKAIKQVSGELRLLEKHRIEMQKASDQLMTRDEHLHVVATLARIIAIEIDGQAHSVPEEILSALTSGGCTISKPKTALKLATKVAHELAEQLRRRIADAIDRSNSKGPDDD